MHTYIMWSLQKLQLDYYYVDFDILIWLEMKMNGLIVCYKFYLSYGELYILTINGSNW